MKNEIIEEYSVNNNATTSLTTDLDYTIKNKVNDIRQVTLVKKNPALCKDNNEIAVMQTATISSPPLVDLLFIKKVHNVYIRLSVNDILWLKGEGNYTKIITTTEQHLVRMYLGVVLKSFCSPYFVRIHKSYIVNMRGVEEIRPSAVLINGEELPVSKSYYKSMMKQVKCYF